MKPDHNAYQHQRLIRPGCEHRLGCKCDTPYWLRPSTPSELVTESRIENQFKEKP